VTLGYQTRLDLLPMDKTGATLTRTLLTPIGLHRLTSCLAAVAEKMSSF